MVTQSTQHIRRTVPLRLKLSSDMAARVDSIARPWGVTSATLGALIVGEFVERYERAKGKLSVSAIEWFSEKEQQGRFEGSSAGAEAAAERSPAGASTERVSTAT